jgi:glyceraldehyde-3-phosphate dehydrogenase (NADP+)
VFAEILDGEVYRYYADGEWRSSASGKSVAIVNPTTRKTQYRVQGAGSRLCSLFLPGSKNLGELVLVPSAVPLFGGKTDG